MDIRDSLVFDQQSRATRWIMSATIFVFALALIVYRDPSLFSAPRYWAEEATLYFHTAYVSPLIEALLAPHQGYYVLWGNLAGMLATTVPLEYAPAIGTAMALLVQLAVIVAILVNESNALDTPAKKAIGSLAAVVVGAAGEIWLTSTNSAAIFPLIVFLILIDDKQNALKRRCWYALVVIAGLSGPQSNILTPLFLVRYWQKRQRGDLVLFTILTCTSLIELGFIIYSAKILGAAAYYSPAQKRFPTHIDPLKVIKTMILYGVKYPLLGYHKTASVIGIILVSISIIISFRKLREFMLFPLAILILTVISVIGSLDMAGGPRYAYVSSVVFALMLLALATSPNLNIVARTLCGTVLCASLFYWCWIFRSGFLYFHDPNWPSWSSEVKAWRADPTRQLQVWPIWDNQTAIGLVWKMSLPAPTQEPPKP
jgi:hypothetical protein